MVASGHRTSVALAPERPDLTEREACLPELCYDLLSDLETVRAYGGAYHSPHPGRFAAVSAGHYFYSPVGNMLHCALPPGVHCRNRPVHRVVEKHRHAVGSTDSERQSRHIGNERVEAFQLRPGHPPFHHGHAATVHLMSLHYGIRQRRIAPRSKRLGTFSYVISQQLVKHNAKIIEFA